MATSRMSSKGQVVIPARIRKSLGLRKGTPLAIREDHGTVVIQPATREYFDQFAGIFKGKGALTKELLAERARDREREDAKWRR